MRRVKAAIIGTGGMARWHIKSMLAQRGTTDITGLVEISAAQREATERVFAEHHRDCPPFFETVRDLLRRGDPADAAFICTPHTYHYPQARECLQAGMDVLLEKPMVINAREAAALIRLRDRSRRLLVVAFPGSLSPGIQRAKALIREGAIGRVTAVAAHVYQAWKKGTTGTWRQDPALSGGGFLFDTGSHMVNTTLDLIGEEIAEVTALADNRGTPVEIAAVVSARSRSGILISLTAAGDSVQCVSEVLVCGDGGILQTGIWGERLNIKRAAQPAFEAVPVPKSRGVWEQFLRVRAGRMPNPCPPEIGLRFARFMDMVRRSAAAGRAVRASP